MQPSQAEQQVAHFLQEHHIIPHQTLIVGVSGGADSVALLRMLHALGQRVVVAHCNFQLRGEESVRDMHFTQQLAATLQLPLECITFDTERIATERKLSIEMACRELRYRWFEELCIQHNAPYIAVAHHRDDSVETVLLNLIRGTGIAGLRGIAPIQGRVIRPLLNLSRSEIVDYLQEIAQPSITDSSNLHDIYTRNKIRLTLLPLMQQINPNLFEAIERTSHHLAECEKVYLHAITQQRKEVTRYEGDTLHISITNLQKQPSPTALLYEILKTYGFLPTQIATIWESIATISGKRFYAPSHTLIKDREEFIVQPNAQATPESEYLIEQHETTRREPFTLTITQLIQGETPLPRCKEIACLDSDKLTYPLTLRRWRQGDRFTPLGMRGSKKLSDYFSDHKYTLFQKESAWLLTSGDEIVWLVGERISEKFKVTDRTNQITVIKCEM